MDDKQLDSFLETEITSAIGYMEDDLAQSRAVSMDRYNGEPLGNEKDGRSQVVTRDTLETVETAMPEILAVMSEADRMLVFEGSGSQEDEEQAIAETDAVSKEIYSMNEGFLLDYSIIKDGLLQKTGIEKIYWDEWEEHEEDEWPEISALELALVDDADDLEIIEKEEVKQEPQYDELGNEYEMEPVYNVKVRRTIQRKQVKIEPVPNEEFLVSKRARSNHIQDAPFCAYTPQKTVGELEAEGFDRKELDKVATGETQYGFTVENARENFAAERDEDDDAIDPSQRLLQVEECYAVCDRKSDGNVGLWQFIRIGGKVFREEKVKHIPFNGWTPIIMPHKFTGMGLSDLVTDLDEIHTILTRQSLDNIYNANHSRNAVSKKVNLDDMLTPRPAGVVRVDDDTTVGHLTPITSQPILGDALNMMRYQEEIRGKRTGVTDTMQGMNQDMVGDTFGALDRITSKAEQKLALITRVLVELALKKRWLMVHDLLREFGEPRMVKLRGEWAEVDPSEWPKRYQCEVKIGLGTGERDKMLAYQMRMLDLQKEAMAGGGEGLITSWDKIYNLIEDISRTAGIKTYTQYWTNPNEEIPSQDPMQPPMTRMQQYEQAKANPAPDPTMVAIETQAQIEANKTDATREKNAMDAQAKQNDQILKERELALEEIKIEQDYDIKIRELESRNMESAARAQGGPAKSSSLVTVDGEKRRFVVENTPDGVKGHYEVEEDKEGLGPDVTFDRDSDGNIRAIKK